MQLKRKDGVQVPVRVDTAPILDEAGRYQGSLAMILDLTERSRSEKALRDSRSSSDRPEDGGRRSAGGRRRPRLQQPAHRHPQLRRAHLADLAGDDPIRADVGEIKKAGERAAASPGSCWPSAARQVLEPRVLDLNDVVASMGKMLRRLLGEDIELAIVAGRTSGAVAGRSRADRAGRHEPGRQRARRHARRGTAHHRDGQRRARRGLRGDARSAARRAAT